MLDWVVMEDLPEKLYEQKRKTIHLEFYDRGEKTSEEGLNWWRRPLWVEQEKYRTDSGR